jgi:hypothetical protein
MRRLGGLGRMEMIGKLIII